MKGLDKSTVSVQYKGMNFIKRLQAENAALRKALTDVRVASVNFRADLTTSKFVGVDSDGGRKDWMSTGDINARLVALEDIAVEGLDA